MNLAFPLIATITILLATFVGGVLRGGRSEARRLKKSLEAARFDAAHDCLSGLLNRRGLLELLHRSARPTAGPSTLYILDLDGFKAVNDTWGHAVGDDVIRRVAKALPTSHQEIAGVARVGGDQFAVVQIGAETPCAVARSILSLFAEPFNVDGRTIEVRASVGSALCGGHVAPQELLRRAGIAVYRAKETGKGHAVTYEPGLDRERQRVRRLECDLRTAIGTEGIEPVFQPVVSSVTRDIVGVEALARWSRPCGRVSPDVFIPLAERSGLINALGVHMLRASIVHATKWPAVTLSVNVSPTQLRDPGFPSQITRTLDEFGFDPTRLTLEITEGVLISNPEQARRSIDQLRNSGIKIALDDFGSGYASVGALRQFGFDRVKMDRSLVFGVASGKDGIDVFRATVFLATALKIPVTAEGIENPVQADIARDAGCDQLQGYWTGKPLSADEISKILVRQEQRSRNGRPCP